MGPDLELEAKSNTIMEISATKQNNGSVLQDPPNKPQSCASNIEDNSFHMGVLFDENAKVQNGSEDVEVDITESPKSGDHGLVEAECQETTENSSSFGDTISGTEKVSSLSDVEVESSFCGGNALASVFDGYNGAFLMRKKKLTDHWRRFVRPIMWRCKWIELRIKELRSQALKYDRELAEYDQRKQFEFEKSTLEGFDAKSRPFSCHIRGNQVMKRKKRKRVEERTDIASYMSQHNLFSYYECKRSTADGACMENDYGNMDIKTVNSNDGFDFKDEWPSLEFRDGDHSLEQLLSKIEVVQSQVRKLKSRIDKVVSENPGKYCSINRLSLLVPCDTSISSDRNAASTPGKEKGMPDRSVHNSSQHISDCNVGDLFMPGSAVSSHGEVTPLSDTIESAGQRQAGGSCETVSDEELQNFERVITQFTDKPQATTRKLNSSPPVMTPETDSPPKTSASPGQPSTSRSNVRNNKRKGGRRKSRMGKWSRRSSG